MADSKSEKALRQKQAELQNLSGQSRSREQELQEKMDSEARYDPKDGDLQSPEAPEKATIQKIERPEPEAPTPAKSFAETYRDLDPLEAEQGEKETEEWLEREWQKQRTANLAHGIISKKDSHIYRTVIRRDIDGDVIAEEKNLENLQAVQSIQSRPKGWIPQEVRGLFPRMPSFLQSLIRRVSKRTNPLDAEV